MYIKKYPKIKSGEWVRPVMKGYNMMCCDCGLVHTLNFKIINKRVLLQAFRNNRATANTRRSKIKRICTVNYKKS